jgi:lipoprotein-anchoring transpeptidase ErfK/SrfK
MALERQHKKTHIDSLNIGVTMQLKTIVLAVGLMATTALTGCSTIGFSYSTASYNSVVDAGYVIPAVPRSKIPPQYLRQEVNYDGSEAPGTIIVDTGTKYLYYVLGGGKAMRYGIGVGKQGFEWHGTARVAMKREWPTWTPPREMIQRQPKLAEFRDGMDPGITNPLGARALYLFNKGGDTGYRLHGTPEWWSIGKAMSSGCIRLMNQDIMDLYNRAEVGAKVIVR